MIFLSSQASLSNKKRRKTEENAKEKNVSRFGKNVTRFDETKNMASTLRKTCHDDQNVTQLWKP